MKDTPLPEAREYERALLGSMILFPAIIPVILSRLGRDDFFSTKHRVIFDGILAAAAKGVVDFNTIREALGEAGKFGDAGGDRGLGEMLDGVMQPTSQLWTPTLTGSKRSLPPGTFSTSVKLWPRAYRAESRLKMLLT